MEIVEDRVLDAGLDDVAGQRLFPHAFGNPHPLHAGLQPRLEPLGVATDLPDPIARRNHRQDRFVIRAAHDLNAAGRHQASESIDVVRMMIVQPLQQRAAGMQRQAQIAIRLKDVQKRQITVLVCLLEYAVEIADRLVIMEHQAETNWVCHGCCDAGEERYETVASARDIMAPAH